MTPACSEALFEFWGISCSKCCQGLCEHNTAVTIMFGLRMTEYEKLDSFLFLNCKV